MHFKLKKLRESKNYSQEYMAFQLKIEQSSYSRIEAGTIKLDLNRLKAIARILDLEFHTLIDILEGNIAK
ncbi:MAG: helix-turn-helix transcriptional regulator [Chitinophagaceae bacterium]|nr:helix-turn-helix transcriptional regulator [Chitinophagaceae bacterium]